MVAVRGSTPPEAFGARMLRREDARLLAGRGRYLADLAVPDVLDVVFVRSTEAHARIRSVDCTSARQFAGVVAVLTAADLPSPDLVDDLHPLVAGLQSTPQPVLARDVVRFVGEPVVMIVAANRYIGEDAAEAVVVEYDPLPSVSSAAAALADGAPVLGPHGSNMVFAQQAVFGDPDAAFARAASVVAHRLETGRYAAMPLETRGCVAEYDLGRARLCVWSSTQSEFVLRRRLATLTGLPEAAITVRVPDVGGGFGQKIPISPEEAAVALAAIRLERPLRWIEDRWENLVAAPHAKQQELELELAVAADGAFLGLRARIRGDIGAYSYNSASGLIEPYIAARYLPGPYLIENYAYDVSAVLTNKSPVAPYRGTGSTAALVALEVLIDVCARQTGLDRLTLRSRNLPSSDQMPLTTNMGKTFDSGSYLESVERMSEVIDYPGFRERQKRLREQGIYRGLGLAVVVESTGRPLIGRFKSSYDGARVSLEPDGSITLDVAVSSQGQGHETSLAQVAAVALGVPIEALTVRRGDTGTAPLSTYGTRASRTAIMSGGAVQFAAEELARRIRAVAGALLDCSMEDIVIAGGVVGHRSLPGPRFDLADIAQAAYFDPDLRRDGRIPEMTVTRAYEAPIIYSNACYAVEVEVDPDLGTVAVERVVAVEDCGTMINPLIVDGQVRGAIIQGLGGALCESLDYDDQAQPQSSTLMDYRVPRSADVPDIEIHHLVSPSPTTSFGAKGVGESGAIGSPAAVAAAVADALEPFGVDVAKLPLTPAQIRHDLGTAAAETHPS